MTLNRILSLAAIAATMLLAGCERPSDSVEDAGAALATAKGCVACHGLNGIGTIPMNPTIAGQWPSYLRTQLQKYRDNDRINAIMNGQAASLTGADIDLLAAYYASR